VGSRINSCANTVILAQVSHNVKPICSISGICFVFDFSIFYDAGDTGRATQACTEALEMAEKLGAGKIVEQMTDLKQGLAKKQVKNS